jgi:membrane-associated protein
MTFSEILAFGLTLLKNPILLVGLVGYIGLFLIIFAETGLLFGFIFPGDSLIVACGIYCFTHDHMNVYLLGTLLSIAACAGDATGYLIGKYLGEYLYTKKESFFFRRQHLLKAKAFYETYGGKTIILSRFIPIIRTFAPTVAGAASMNYKKFAFYNIIGGLAWIWSLLMVGFFLGKYLGDLITKYIHVIIIVIIILSILPPLYEYLKRKKVKKTKKA